MPQEAFTINEFCLAHRISRATYYNIKKAGLGPKEMRLIGCVLISREAAEEWRRQREDAPRPEAA